MAWLDIVRSAAVRMFAAMLCAVVALLMVVVPPAQAEPESIGLLADTHFGYPGSPWRTDTKAALRWELLDSNLKGIAVAGDVTDRGAADSYKDWVDTYTLVVKTQQHRNVKRIQAMGDHDTGKNGIYYWVDNTLTVWNGRCNFVNINGGAETSFTQFSKANVITFGGIRASGFTPVTKDGLKELDDRLRTTARQGKVAIVVCHYPHDSGVLNMRADLLGILRSYPNVIWVSGHTHNYAWSKQFRTVTPSCNTTPYSRAGFNKNTKYAFHGIGVNAVNTCRSSDGNVYADLLTIYDDGTVSAKKQNVTKNRTDRTWSFKQSRSSITVKAAGTGTSYPKSATFTFKVTFSDGKSHGGIKSGGTFGLRVGSSRTFPDIPSGVLVTVKMMKGPDGWSTGASQALEVTQSPRSMTLTSQYVKPTYYTVTFKDGVTGKTIKTQKVLKGNDATFPSAPKHEGYTFNKWSATGKKVTKNMTITAQYTKKEQAPITLKV